MKRFGTFLVILTALSCGLNIAFAQEVSIHRLENTPEVSRVGQVLEYRIDIDDAASLTGANLTWSAPDELIDIESVGTTNLFTSDWSNRTFNAADLAPGRVSYVAGWLTFKAISAGSGNLRATGTLTTLQGTVNVDKQLPIIVQPPDPSDGVAVVSIDPPQVVPSVGSRLTIPLKITNARNIVGYQATVNFDPSVLRYVSSAYANYLPAGAFVVPPLVTEGSVIIGASGSKVGAASGTLATVTFEVVVSKKPTIWLTDVLLVGEGGEAFAVLIRDGSPEEERLILPPENESSAKNQGTAEAHPEDHQAAIDPDAVFIPDSNFRFVIEEALGKTSGARITQADMLTLTDIEGKYNIQDITGIEFAKNLRTLDFWFNRISDISPLAQLVNLTELNLGDNQISDISPLTQLINLTKLDLGGNQISDISPLTQLINLTELNLMENQISDISPLTQLINLTKLNLVGNRVSNMSSLTQLINLTNLYLMDNRVSDVSPLMQLINLTKLNLASNRISNISSLTQLINLRTLDLSGNRISDISPLAQLINLTNLDLDGNQILDFSPVAGVPNVNKGVQRLNVATNPNAPVNIPDPVLRTNIERELRKTKNAPITQEDLARLVRINLFHTGTIQDLTGLEFAINLTALNLAGNRVSDISPLAQLINLTELNLAGNQISDISPLAQLINLTELNLGKTHLRNNRVSDISPLAQLINLTELNLAGNQISDISPLAQLINLTELNLAGNQISDFSPIEELIPNLEVYDSSGQGGVSIFIDAYTDLGGGVFADFSRDKGSVFPPGSRQLIWFIVKKNRKPVKGISLVLTATAHNSSATASFSSSTITTDENGKAFTYITFGEQIGKIELHAAVKSNYMRKKTINQHGTTVYKHSDGNKTVLIKGLPFSDEIDPQTGFIAQKDKYVFLSDYTRLHPPRIGKYFRIYGQGKTNNCGQTAARMVLSYYGVDVELETFNDVADIQTTLVGTTPNEMKQGLKLLPVDLDTYSGTSANYPRDKSLRDKISESRPPILVTRTGKNAYHHIVVVGYDTKTDQFLIADPGGEGGFYWEPWDVLNTIWRLDYQAGKTWEQFLKKLNKPNAWGQAPFVPDIKFALKWVDGVAPYRMYVPKEAPPYHHLASETHQIYETGPANANFLKLDRQWHDWKWERTFDGKVISVDGFVGELRDADVRETRIDGNKVIISGRIADGAPLDADIVGGVFQGSVDLVLTVYYDPFFDDAAAPTLILSAQPTETSLFANYPNPFNPETWIPYHLATPADVTLTIYAIDGKVVRRLDLGHQAAGYYQSKARAAYWDGRNRVGERVASGIYFYTLTAGDFHATRKMLIVK